MGLHKGIVGRQEVSSGPASCDLDKMVKTETTLQDYLEKKYPEQMKKKLTFEEWADSRCLYGEQLDFCRDAWNAAQENK